MKAEIVLAFDCSAAHCAAALLLGGRVVTCVEPMAKGQAERLVPMLEELLAAEGVEWQALSAIAVGVGPGNFTGVRIAVALARGLALGLGVPAVGVTGFEALAEGRPVMVAIEAPRGAAYVQDFGGAAGGLAGAFIAEAMPEGAVVLGDVGAFVASVARVGAVKARLPQPRPAPFYLRSADAAPASDPPPVILP